MTDLEHGLCGKVQKLRCCCKGADDEVSHGNDVKNKADELNLKAAQLKENAETALRTAETIMLMNPTGRPEDGLDNALIKLAQDAIALAQAANSLAEVEQALALATDAIALAKKATDLATSVTDLVQRRPAVPAEESKNASTKGSEATSTQETKDSDTQIVTTAATNLDVPSAPESENASTNGSDTISTQESAQPLTQEQNVAYAQDVARAGKLAQAAVTALCLVQEAAALKKAAEAVSQKYCMQGCGTCLECLCSCGVCSCCTLKPEFPHADRKTLREIAQHEDNLLDQRRTHFALLQGFLWSAAGFMVHTDQCKLNAVLATIIAAEGCFLAMLATFSLRLSGRAVEKLQNNGATKKSDLVVGLDARNPEGLWEWFLFKCFDPSIMPLSLAVTWLLFIIYLNKKGLGRECIESDPMEIALIRNDSYPMLIEYKNLSR